MELLGDCGLCPDPAEGGCSAPGPALGSVCAVPPSSQHILCQGIIPRAATQIPLELWPGCAAASLKPLKCSRGGTVMDDRAQIPDRSIASRIYWDVDRGCLHPAPCAIKCGEGRVQ